MWSKSIQYFANRFLKMPNFRRFALLGLCFAAFSWNTAQAQTVAYVTNNTSIQSTSAAGNTVSVINTATNTVTATITVGSGPTGVVFAPNGALAYVTNLNDGTISVINTSTNKVTTTINLGSTVQPALLAITPNGNSLYVPDQNNGNVLVVSTATNTVTATIPVVSGAFAVSITPDGSNAYVLSQIGSGVSVIATATNTVSTTIPVVALAGFNMAITPNGSDVFVAGGLFQTIPIITTSSNTVTNTISLPNSNFAFFLGITPNGQTMYVSNGNENSADPNTVLTVNLSNDTVNATTIPVGSAPAGLAITPAGDFVYVANNGSNNVSVISTATNTVVATVPVGVTPFSVAIATLNANAQFAAFTVKRLRIGECGFRVKGDLTLAANTTLDFDKDATTLTVGNFSVTIPAGKIKEDYDHRFVFKGRINGLTVDFDLKPEEHSSTSFDYNIHVRGVDVDTPNPVKVTLQIGAESGTAMVDQRNPHDDDHDRDYDYDHDRDHDCDHDHD